MSATIANQTEPRKRQLQPIKTPSVPVDLSNVQGDIHPTFVRKSEKFIFFQISDVEKFRPALAKLVPYITTSSQVTEKLDEINEFRRQHINDPKPIPREQLVKFPQVNISFSAKALPILGLNGDLGDVDFQNGQAAEAIKALGDHPDPSDPTGMRPAWDAGFQQDLHGMILVAAEHELTVEATVGIIRGLLYDSIKVMDEIVANARPGDQEGHEHFGWRDGISQPALRGLTDPLPGQLQCDPGVVIFGYEGDTVQRPAWAKDGSLAAFRKLRQYVPEFKSFLGANPITDVQDISPKDGAALRCARFFGRWPSGAPLDLSPNQDDPTLAADPEQNNNFDYTKLEPGETTPGQIRCPFSSHIRKSAPRLGTSYQVNDLEQSMIVRSSLPYGIELTDTEQKGSHTTEDRGLAFISYQTIIHNGFKRLQKDWYNNVNFPPQWMQDTAVNGPPGYDPIVGSIQGNAREVTGTDAAVQDLKTPLVLPTDFVVATGGEYFFVPSISTLKTIASGGPIES